MYENKFQNLCRKSAEAGETNDCSVKALAIVCKCNYAKAHLALRLAGRKNGGGAPVPTITKALYSLGFYITKTDGRYAKGVDLGGLKAVAPKLDRGLYMVFVRGHVLAVHNGQIHDWTEGRRHRVKMIWKIERKA